jgi:DNA-binding XRE family transcriptional regulator
MIVVFAVSINLSLRSMSPYRVATPALAGGTTNLTGRGGRAHTHAHASANALLTHWSGCYIRTATALERRAAVETTPVPGAKSKQEVRFGEVLRRYRVAAGLTQEALAERAAMSARGISDLERAARTHPYPATVRRLGRGSPPVRSRSACARDSGATVGSVQP